MSRNGLHYDRTRNTYKPKRSRFFARIALFLGLVLVLGVISFLALWRSLDYDFSNFFKNGKTEITEPAQPVTEPQKSFSGEYDFVSLVTSDDKSAVYCAQIICVDLAEKTVRVVPIDVLSDFSGQSFASFAKTATGDEIKAALSEKYNINISRYLILTESKYRAVFRTLGNITVNIPDDVQYDTDDMFLELTRGENILPSEKVHKYMRYAAASFDSKTAARRHAEICTAAFESYYTSEHYANADNLFGELINCFTSDITIVDYTDAKEQIGSLVPRNSKEHLKVYISDTVRETADEE